MIDKSGFFVKEKQTKKVQEIVQVCFTQVRLMQRFI
jgi:hypothetical protein